MRELLIFQHGHSSTFSACPLSNTYLAFEETLGQPPTTNAEISGDIASFYRLTQLNHPEGVSSLSAEGYDNSVTSFHAGSFSLQEQCNTESSSSLIYGDVKTRIAGSYDSSGSLIPEEAPLLTCQDNRAVERTEPYNLDKSLGHVFDPALVNSSSNARRDNSSSFDSSHFAFESMQAVGESIDYSIGLPVGSNLGQHQQQQFLSDLPGATDVPFSMLNSLGNYHFASQPSEPTSDYSGRIMPSIMDPWDRLQPTYSDEIAIEAQHGDEPAIKPKLRKAYPKLKKVRGVKTYSCSVCLVSSGDVRSLSIREHMRCHEKTHACTVSGCAQSFSTSRDLTRHVKSAHSNTFLTCSICFAPIKVFSFQLFFTVKSWRLHFHMNVRFEHISPTMKGFCM
ncbi:Regulatory protein MIG1 [Colletotrichum fructicola]|nr:Regulatory protein MIG1 [Colletotrichum fructicola]